MKLINLIPLSDNFTTAKVISKEEMNEDLNDMDVSLPGNVERFLDKATKIIKSYNLSTNKEQYIIAKLIDSLNMNPNQLSNAVQKLKKYKIVKR